MVKTYMHSYEYMKVFLLSIVKQFQLFYKICYTEIDHISSLLLSSLHRWRHSSQPYVKNQNAQNDWQAEIVSDWL